MSLAFDHRFPPGTVFFGAGARDRLPEALDALGVSRALLLSTPHQADGLEPFARALGDRCVGRFTEAAMHTPVEVSERAAALARELDADVLVAFGGGSTTGLGKAIAHRTGLDQIAIPTTYAGSEATPILGQTEGGEKVTLKDPGVLPELVIYDPELSTGLPVAMSVTSGLNAMAHAVEALYAPDASPISSLLATEGLSALHRALPGIVARADDGRARADALYGAWLSGHVLGSVGMGLHHKLCHALGGSFDLPHAETHAVLLPHSVAYNAAAARETLRPVARVVAGDEDAPPGAALHDFARELGAPLSLEAFGFGHDDVERAARIAASKPYPNPAPLEEGALAALLHRAVDGHRPDA